MALTALDMETPPPFDPGVYATGHWTNDFGEEMSTVIYTCGCVRDTNLVTGEGWWHWCDRRELTNTECIRRKIIRQTVDFLDIGWSPRSEGFCWDYEKKKYW